jgi:dihydroorotate dehydrogenase (fumarate)
MNERKRATMDLTTTYMGLKLKNPLICGAGPLTGDLDGFKRLEDAGAAAIVMHSLFEEQIAHEARELHYYTTAGAESFAESLSYFPEAESYQLGPEEYLALLRKAKETVKVPVIASLNGVTRGGWVKIARKMEEAGADAIELNVYLLPTSASASADEIEGVYLNILAAVKDCVKIPVAMKLSPFFSSIPNMARKLDAMDADALVLFNRFYQPDLDLENLTVVPKVQLSQPGSMLLPLRWIAILHGHVKASLAASTGVHSAADALKCLMAGADAVQMCAALIQNGPGHLADVIKGMIDWMQEHEYDSVTQMKGSMSHRAVAEPAAFERANYMKALSGYRA